MDSINNATKLGGGDAWLELQAFKTRQINRREKLNRHKDLINGITTNQNLNQQSLVTASSSQQIDTNIVQTDSNRTLNSNRNITDSHQTPLTDDSIANNDNKHCSFAEDELNATFGSEWQQANSYNSPTMVSDNSCIHKNSDPSRVHIDMKTVECLLLLKLCDVALKLPIDSRSLQRSICRVRGLASTPQSLVENLLEKFAHQELIAIEEPSTATLKRLNKQSSCNDSHDDESCLYVISADHTKLVEFDKTFGSSDSIRALLIESRSEDVNSDEIDACTTHKISIPAGAPNSTTSQQTDFRNKTTKSSVESLVFDGEKYRQNHVTKSDDSRQIVLSDDVESLLSLSSTKEKESKKLGEELLELLSKPTAKEKNLLERFRSADGYQVQEFCPKGTKDECRRNRKGQDACDKLHFKKIIAKHTEESLGDCSFLNTCFHMDSCKYVHYEVDYDNNHNRHQAINSRKTNRGDAQSSNANLNQFQEARLHKKDIRTDARQTNQIATFDQVINKSNDNNETSRSNTNNNDWTLNDQLRLDMRTKKRFKTVLYPPQWIQCDLRYFDMSLLGKFSVVMADPPWDIHMELPYGTMSDEEMRKLNVPALQDEGVIFLWVTGRAMELGRECLALWGYERCDEMIWVKTNQLQRIIRTGRTGHWLNHGKEHCLVGIKGNPTDINRGLDCDIIVAEVRATSHKPDEIYGIIERLSPGTRKIELFGRAHNVQPNWITLGNQLNGVKLVEPNLIEAFKKLNIPFETGDHIMA